MSPLPLKSFLQPRFIQRKSTIRSIMKRAGVITICTMTIPVVKNLLMNIGVKTIKKGNYMKTLLVAAGFWLVSTGLIFAQEPQAGSEPFAVVELFASEGCSDCPPADDLLRQITNDARSNGKRIYTLSFQVDYWNNLGWTDPFSSPVFSQRQQQYSGFLPGGVYTPEMIINGKEAFVGSDGGKAQNYIDHYLSVPSENNITLNLDQSGNELKVNYTVAQQDGNSVINFALVERGLVSHVTGGENGGSTLEHDNVVREFKTIDLNNVQGTVVFSKPQGGDLTRFSVIAYVQSKQDMAISAASGVDLK